MLERLSSFSFHGISQVVDDIVDTGLTLSKLIHTLEEYGTKKIWTALLLSKRVPRKVDVAEDFVAFHIPDKVLLTVFLPLRLGGLTHDFECCFQFIVGYGLDYNQKFRDLNHICVMSAAGVEKYKNS
ncbi:unnamed protein product [Heligmosomoides polygyrus]|uniref:Phosphoribosyltransferase domain-containing protein n=1 Tax=Heligmosomoides polygyrus TaxID=6339 RepID=A0A3P8ARH1_HELPZ|nr:unnamed protein product [Heligmosomoides polygyrus]